LFFPSDCITSVEPGAFTVCIRCREILRFNDELQLQQLTIGDLRDLARDRSTFVDLLRWRLYLLVEQLNDKTCDIADGLPRRREVHGSERI
jgi:hypothetical protein